jgi:hypothetical protein
MAFALAAGFYLLLIDITVLPELYAGLAAALIAAAGCEVARLGGLGGTSVRPKWVLRGWRAVAHVPGDVWWVSVAALEQLVAPQRRRGVLRAVAFDFGEPDQAADAGRRALAEALGSLTPNSIVIGIDQERNLILVHQLRRTGGAEALDVLQLG